MSGQCLVPGCHAAKGSRQIMCRRHWFMVPKPLRDQVWIEYRRKPKSPEHFGVIVEALTVVMEKEGART